MKTKERERERCRQRKREIKTRDGGEPSCTSQSAGYQKPSEQQEEATAGPALVGGRRPVFIWSVSV